jgi:hypothetical protein
MIKGYRPGSGHWQLLQNALKEFRRGAGIPFSMDRWREDDADPNQIDNHQQRKTIPPIRSSAASATTQLTTNCSARQ